MQAKDSYEDRVHMAEMHNDVRKKIETAVESEHYIEACWLCYACFESRITRTLEKVSEKCPNRGCYQNIRVGIRKKINCLKKLSNQKYLGMERFDKNLFKQIEDWCDERNILVHALVTLENYDDMDEQFIYLSQSGLNLVKELYAQTTTFRNNYYIADKLPQFPQNIVKSCRLSPNRSKT